MSSGAPFTHLHVHSEFSLLSGVPGVEELAEKAKERGFGALALTDTNRMSGLIAFYKACRALDMHPILGVEISEAQAPGENVVLLARNARGYGDLCEITTRRHRGGFTLAGAFAREWPDLLLLTAHPRCLKLLAAGPNRPYLYGELVRHCAATRARSREMEALCDSEGIPVAASGDCHFVDAENHAVHRILRAIDLNSTLSRLEPGETAPPGAWLQDSDRMADLFADRPDALRNAAAIAGDCDVRLDLGRWVMPVLGGTGGESPDAELEREALRGLERNYAGKPEYAKAKDVQEMELRVIRNLGYSSYFLMVKEVRDWASGAFGEAYRRARDCSILRGSGANSITFYNLGVCNLDPIGLDLYFQRFLNEDRAAPPDADLDFGWDERERALDHIVETYGRDRVAITCTTNRFRFQSAFREVAKVFGYSDAQVTEVMQSFGTNTRKILHKEIFRLIYWASRIEGKARFLGQHPGGLIITNQPIYRHVACEWSRGLGEDGGRGRLVTQIDMHSGIDDLGLIKFDLLGNGSLSVLRDALRQLHEQGYPDPEVWDVEKCFRDPAVADMIKTGRTRGIFYIESPAQIRLNQRARAETFPEIVITSSLVRPAGTAYCSTFVERHRKMKMNLPRDWDYLHPSLEGILEETHDVCAFQEDVIRVCHDVAGLPFKEADRIRKMMNSQHEGAVERRLWDRTREDFIAGCMRNPHPQPFTTEQASELWTRVASFTGFSFCKSHSASYAELSFQCSYLKAHYPAQFLSAVISNRHGFYTRNVYLDEARRWGLRILPVCVNASRLHYHGKDDWIRPGLSPLRDCREAALRVLVQERDENGPYRHLGDLLRRVPLHKREAENLILAGACDAFGLTQPQLLYQLDAAVGSGGGNGQADLFGSEPAQADAGFRAPDLADYPLFQRCLNELRTLGYILSADLLDVVDVHPESRNAVRAKDLPAHVGRRVKVLGIPVTDRLHAVAASPSPDAEGGERLMKFLTLGDRTGYIDAIFWPDALDRWNDVLAGQVPFSGSLIEVQGVVREDWDTYALEAEQVRVIPWLPNQMDFDLASRRLKDGLRTYATQDTRGLDSLAA